MNPSRPAEQRPAVTVIIVNYNGRAHLPECLESLAHLTYSSDRISICLVDNHSSDDSVEWVNYHYPHVTVIRLDENLGFAESSNIGARAAHTPLIAFLNNDTRVDSGWLSALVDLKQSAPDIASVGSKMLSWDGKWIDFVQGVLGYYGHAFQRDAGRPAELYANDKPREILFACGGSMLVDRDVFVKSGGFDAKYFAYFEDVDLGWRLWLMGYRVLFAPDAITYHRGHATGAGVPFSQRLVLFERNAFCTLYKNLDEKNVWRFLSSSLLLAFKRQERWLNLDGCNTSEFNFDAPIGNGDSLLVRREVLSHTLAVGQFVDCLEDLQGQRMRIQSLRKRSDSDIFNLFEQALRPHVMQSAQVDEGYALAHYVISAVSGITQQFETMRRRVLFVCEQCLQSDGPFRADSRTDMLMDALRTAGHEVILLMSPAAGGERVETVHHIVTAESDWADILYRVSPDVVIARGHEVLRRLPYCHLPLAMDESRLPHFLEQAGRIPELSRVDFFTYDSAAHLKVSTDILDAAGFANLAKYSAVVAMTPDGDNQGAIAPLDRFCRMPYKRRAFAPIIIAQPDAGSIPADRLRSAIAPRRKGLRQLLGEAVFHYRRGGIRVLSIEALGFLRRRLDHQR